MKSKKLSLTVLLLLLALTLSACGKVTEDTVAPPAPLAVKGQTVGESLSVKQDLSYPAMVAPDSEATIVAKASGNLTAVKFKVGDSVYLGQELAKVDDVNSTSFNAANFNTNQIKQAKIAVSQAQAAYDLARTSYNNLLISSVKDLRSAEIARDQASKIQSNLDITTAESLKSAQLAYDTAKIATESANSTLTNREKLSLQGAQDAQTNADLAANSVASNAGAIITNINNLGSFDDKNNVAIGYRTNLGALDSSTYDTAKQDYKDAQAIYADYLAQKFSTVADKVDAAIALANATKTLTGDTKRLLDKSIPSSSLPQSAASGVSLSGLQAAVAGYDAQINASLSQINASKQALTNVDLNNTTLLDSLRQALRIAQQQEASAKQALVNLQSGNTSQQNNAGFSANLAENQYENTKVKIESQINAAKTQMETAQMQYNNASVSLQSLYDAHSVIAPLDGTITKVFVTDGQAVVAGQAIATVSQTDNLKIQFYIEAENLSEIKSGLPVKVVDSSNVSYDGLISAVSPQADQTTRRFLAEVKLENPKGLLLGTVVTVNLEIKKDAKQAGTIILPLSAVTIGQNGSFIFINDNGLAKKVTVTVAEVIGELAEVKVDLPASAVIITEGNRLLQEGQAITLNQ